MGRNPPAYEIVGAWIAGVLSGIAGAMGIGGGSVLINYLTVFASVAQLKAQGINLMFFIPCGLIAIVIHVVKKRIKWGTVFAYIIGGLPGIAAGFFFADYIGSEWIGKIFAVLLIALGLWQMFARPKSNGRDAQEAPHGSSHIRHR